MYNFIKEKLFETVNMHLLQTIMCRFIINFKCFSKLEVGELIKMLGSLTQS